MHGNELLSCQELPLFQVVGDYADIVVTKIAVDRASLRQIGIIRRSA